MKGRGGGESKAEYPEQSPYNHIGNENHNFEVKIDRSLRGSNPRPLTLMINYVCLVRARRL